MLKQILVIIAISTLSNSVFARQNIIKPKVVFIHGWLGWGEGKMLGIRWGGPFLSVKAFEQESYDTIELGVGPYLARGIEPSKLISTQGRLY